MCKFFLSNWHVVMRQWHIVKGLEFRPIVDTQGWQIVLDTQGAMYPWVADTQVPGFMGGRYPGVADTLVPGIQEWQISSGGRYPVC